MGRYYIDATCPRCKQTHKFPLDASGHYTGALPCTEDKNLYVTIQVDPPGWRSLMEEQAEKTAH